jgi:hypothetical protein
MSDDDVPSTSRLAGQLGYLFEERPRLQQATAEELAEQLNHEDRYARARQKYVLESDQYVHDHLDEFPPRITSAMIERALQEVRGTGDDQRPGAASGDA